MQAGSITPTSPEPRDQFFQGAKISHKEGHLYESWAQLSVQRGNVGKIARIAYQLIFGKETYKQVVDAAARHVEGKMQVHWKATKNAVQDPSAYEKDGLPLLPNDFSKESKSFVTSRVHNLAYTNFMRKQDSELPPLKSLNGKEWIPYRKEAGKLEKGFVYTTAERARAESQKEKASLSNVYTHEDQEGRITITCGVIDTKEKADIFIATVRQLSDKPPHIVMHQLNSFGTSRFAEAKMIKNQHNLASYIDSQLKAVYDLSENNPPLVAHTNRAINGFTRLATLTREDKKAARNNVSGWATQLLWLEKDKKLDGLKPDGKLHNRAIQELNSMIQEGAIDPKEGTDKIAYHQKSLREIDTTKTQQLLSEIYKLESDLAINKGNKESEKEISRLRDELKTELHTVLDILKSNNSKLTPELRIFTHLVSHELGLSDQQFPTLTPAQQIGMQLLLDRSSNAISEINCKSGLDRTGFVRAMQGALITQFSDLQEGYDFLLNYESAVKEMDTQLSADSQNPLFKYDTWLKNHPQYEKVAQFQAHVWAELCSVGLPITARSAGMAGFKWHHGKRSLNPLERNCHPLPYLPRFVGINTTKGLEWHEITRMKNGERISLTAKGNDVLTGLSNQRKG